MLNQINSRQFGGFTIDTDKSSFLRQLKDKQEQIMRELDNSDRTLIPVRPAIEPPTPDNTGPGPAIQPPTPDNKPNTNDSGDSVALAPVLIQKDDSSSVSSSEIDVPPELNSIDFLVKIKMLYRISNITFRKT